MGDSQNITREHKLLAAIKDWTGDRLIGDDCALLPGQTLVSVDTLVEGNHFKLCSISMEDLGWKSLAVNISDIAAMGGQPRFALVSLTLPNSLSEAQLERFYAGLLDCARAYRCRIVGGDLTRGNQLMISITILGEANSSGVAFRANAQSGDLVICTGDFGASAAGLWLIERGEKRKELAYCIKSHFRPLPQLKAGRAFIETTGGRGALMDTSDGLADALVQIARASAVGIEIDAAAIPVNSATIAAAKIAGVDYLDWALYGGEDYQLAGTISPSAWEALSKRAGDCFVKIGTVTGDKNRTIVRKENGERQELQLNRTFQHWS